MSGASSGSNHLDNAEDGQVVVFLFYTRETEAPMLTYPKSLCFKWGALILEPRALCLEDPLSDFLLQMQQELPALLPGGRPYHRGVHGLSEPCPGPQQVSVRD